MTLRWFLSFTALALALAGCASTDESTDDAGTSDTDCPDGTDDTTMGGDGSSNGAAGGDSTGASGGDGGGLYGGQIGDAMETNESSGANVTEDCPSDATGTNDTTDVTGGGDHTASGT